MEPDLQKAIDSGKLTDKEAAILQQLSPQSYCHHKSWGFGQVTEWNLLLNQITIDFGSKKGHVMQCNYAAQSLQPLGPDHILVRKAKAPATVKAEAKTAPLQLARNILESFAGKATQDQFAGALIPEVFSEAEFKRWWESAKKAMKKDGHFDLPAKRTEGVMLRQESIPRSQELLDAFEASSQIKARLLVVGEILKSPDAFDQPDTQLAPVVAALEEATVKNQKLHPAQAVESLIARDELADAFQGLLVNAKLTLPNFVSELSASLAEVLEALPAGRQKAMLKAFPATFGEGWPDAALKLMPLTGSRTVGDIAKILREHDKAAVLHSRIGHWIRERSMTTEMLCWFCKDRKNGLMDLIQPNLLGSILSALERDQFSERRTMRLQDMLIDDRDLMTDILAKADRDAVRELMRRLMLSTVFEELTKRSLLARIIKLHPEMQTMLTGDEREEQQEALIVSWESLDARKKEYDDLVNKKIPENSKEISVARSYGDLRENFEFKAAKEMQAVLARRKAELEHDLGRARGTAFENPDTTQVSIGTAVTVRDIASGAPDTYTLLGAWDGKPEQHLLSYLTVIGQALLGRKPGDQVELPTEQGTRHVEVLDIQPYRTAVPTS